MFDKLFGWLKKLWNKLKPFFAIVLVCLAIYFTFGGGLAIPGFELFGMVFAGFELTGAAAAVIAGSAALLVDSETVLSVVENVTEGVTEVATSVAGGILSGVSSSLFSSPIATIAGVGLLAAGAYFIYKRMNDNGDAEEMAAYADDQTMSDSNEDELIGEGDDYMRYDIINDDNSQFV
jgi:hypothetical protein